jgi:hypothetical protein
MDATSKCTSFRSRAEFEQFAAPGIENFGKGRFQAIEYTGVGLAHRLPDGDSPAPVRLAQDGSGPVWQ